MTYINILLILYINTDTMRNIILNLAMILYMILFENLTNTINKTILYNTYILYIIIIL